MDATDAEFLLELAREGFVIYPYMLYEMCENLCRVKHEDTITLDELRKVIEVCEDWIRREYGNH